ncbi:MAG: MFS transporter [Myxococcales bacterium]|nr:MFS transporter [Myxococcales bacterium]
MPLNTLAFERKIIVLLAAVNFINILDFMIVMPMGPDFAAALGIPLSRLGLVGGAYTAAAAVSGLAASTFLDRFDRRRALSVALWGLVGGTLLGALAQGFTTLVLARVVAGAFGGPATALSLSILADVVPPERRGKAMGSVMGAFAAASVLGVPAGLELAQRWGWRAPFFAVAALGVVVILLALALMPPMRAHLDKPVDAPPRRPLVLFLRDSRVRLSLAATGAAFLGMFALVPNLAAYLQFNLGYPREGLGGLYLAGGLVSFVAMRVGGIWVDRHGPNVVTITGSACMMAVLAFGFWPLHPLMPVVAMFVLLMTASSLRSVALNTVSSRVPPIQERGRFMSTQSATQHIAAASGAALSSLVLVERPDHSLAGMQTVVAMAFVMTALLPLLVWQIDRRVRTAASTVSAR